MTLYSAKSFAAENSEEYIACISQEELTDEMRFNCIKEENLKVRRHLEELSKQLELTGQFGELAAQKFSLSEQLENWLKYVNSYCEYKKEASPCPEDGAPQITTEECINSFNITLETDWEDLLNTLRQKQMKNNKF